MCNLSSSAVSFFNSSCSLRHGIITKRYYYALFFAWLATQNIVQSIEQTGILRLSAAR